MIKVGIKDWAIDLDTYGGFVVGKLKERQSKDKDGSIKTTNYIDDPKYPPTLKLCFERILKVENALALGGSELHDLEEAVRIIDRNYQMVNDALRRALKEELW